MDEITEDQAVSQDAHQHQKIEEEKLPFAAQPFETSMNEIEMDFLQKLMPKGYSLSNSFRSTRPRVSKYVSLVQAD